MSVFDKNFGFYCEDERLNFDFLTLFSFFEKIENAFISEFLQAKSLKGDVVDFPLITGGIGELDFRFSVQDLRFAAQKEGLYFYDRQEKNTDSCFGSCFGFNSDYFSYANFDNSVRNFHHRALNNFFNDNPHYVFDCDCSNSEKYQSFDSCNDFKGENYQGEYKTVVPYNRKKEISQQIYESGRGNLEPFSYSVLSSGFLDYSKGTSDIGGAVCFLDKGFDGEKRNAFFAFEDKKNYFADDGNYFPYNTNYFSDSLNCFLYDGNYFVEGGRYFDNKLAVDRTFEPFEDACKVNKASAFDMLVQPVVKIFSDRAELFSQGENLFSVNRENELALKMENQSFKCQDKVLTGYRKDFAAYEFWRSKKRIVQGYEHALDHGNFYVADIGLLQGEDTLSPGQEIIFGGETSHFESAKLLLRINRAFEGLEKIHLFASTAFDGFEVFENLSQAANGSYCLSQEDDKSLGGAFLMRHKENAFEKCLYLCNEESGELHISFEDLKKAIGTGALEYGGKPVKAEIKVDMSGMKNIIYKETSIDSVVTDLTAAVSEAVTAAAEGVHIL